MSGRVLIVVLVLAAASCVSHSDQISISGVGAVDDGSTLLVVVALPDVEGQSCWVDLTITPVEDQVSVQLDVSGRKSTGDRCDATTERVRLAEPLGARTVRDGASGEPLSLLPVAVPETTWLPDGWVVRESSGGQTGWVEQAGIAGTTMSVQVELFRTGTNTDLRGSTITSPATVQGRPAAFVKVRSRTSGPPSLLMMDPTWSLMVWSSNNAVTTETLQRIAGGLTPVPFASTIDPPAIEPPTTGTVAELIDVEGPVILTGWLSVDDTGRAQFCESLANNGSCQGATVDIDWDTGSARPPADLIANGNRNVSTRALTLAGTLKDERFFVGL